MSESLFLRFRDHLFSINTSVVQRRLLSMLTGAPYEPEPSTRKLHLLPSAIIAGHTDGLRGARKLHAETSTTTSSLLRKRMMTQSQPEDEAEAKKYCLHFPAWALEALPDAIFGFKQIWDKEETETVFTFIENIPEKYFFNNETRILLRAPGMRQVYMLHAGQRIPINSAAEMVELGREWGDVLSVSVKQMTMLCELFACDYDPVSGGLIL